MLTRAVTAQGLTRSKYCGNQHFERLQSATLFRALWSSMGHYFNLTRRIALTGPTSTFHSKHLLTERATGGKIRDLRTPEKKGARLRSFLLKQCPFEIWRFKSFKIPMIGKIPPQFSYLEFAFLFRILVRPGIPSGAP